MDNNLARTGRTLTLAVLCAVLSACALVPSYERPELELPSESQAGTQLAKAQYKQMAHWWRRFDDPRLNELISSAMANNLSIALQAAKIQEARARLGLAQAQFYPTLGGQIKASRTKASVSASPGRRAVKGNRYSDAYRVAATLGYELNIFSALAGHEAAQAQLLSSAFSRDAMRLAIISDIVANYMSLRAIQRKIRITKGTIQTRKEGLELAEKRYEYGAISKLAILQKRAILASARSRLPELRQQAGRLESALAILTGKTPQQIMNEADIEPAPLAKIKLPGHLPVLLPSALVNRRPDIRASEAALVAADAQVSVAKAQYFPSLDLTAMVGSAAMSVSSLFEPMAETASISGMLTAPLLSFGRIGAQVDSAEAQRRQAVIMYRQTVRQAFRQVRDALIGIQVTQKRVKTTRNQVQAYKKTLKLAKKRYRVGRVGLRNVLEAQRSLFKAQLALSGAIRDRFVATANLFKALGGGWTEKSDSVPEDIDTGLPEPQDNTNTNANQAQSTTI